MHEMKKNNEEKRMPKDIVYDEIELSMVMNSIVNYADFLSRCIEQYIGLLNQLKNKGIQDELICSKIEALVVAIKPYKTVIYEECKGISEKVNKSLIEVESADNFYFPNDIVSMISSLLAKFW